MREPASRPQACPKEPGELLAPEGTPAGPSGQTRPGPGPGPGLAFRAQQSHPARPTWQLRASARGRRAAPGRQGKGRGWGRRPSERQRRRPRTPRACEAKPSQASRSLGPSAQEAGHEPQEPRCPWSWLPPPGRPAAARPAAATGPRRRPRSRRGGGASRPRGGPPPPAPGTDFPCPGRR